jgi:hypothetical protein
MNAVADAMKVTYQNLRDALREQLRERIEAAARLRCAEHGRPVAALTIHGRENGWFDPVWITCCATLEAQALAIVKTRC